MELYSSPFSREIAQGTVSSASLNCLHRVQNWDIYKYVPHVAGAPVKQGARVFGGRTCLLAPPQNPPQTRKLAATDWALTFYIVDTPERSDEN